MGYRKIPNLYQDTKVLQFKECYACEKIHGSSANISWLNKTLTFSSGGSSHVTFKNLFNEENLISKFTALGHENIPIVVYGEAYGGKLHGMSSTYGKELAFIAFEVRIGEYFLDVPKAEKVVLELGLEFVPYEQGPAEVEWLNAQRDADSIVAIRRGMGPGKIREGVVIRPLVEVTFNNGGRIMSKHKRAEFSETKTMREVDTSRLKMLDDANEIAEEWVTEMRLTHVLQNFEEPHTIAQIRDVISATLKDVLDESAGEIIDSKESRKAICQKASALYKDYLKNKNDVL